MLKKIQIEVDLYDWLIQSLQEFQDEVEQDNTEVVTQLKKKATEFSNRLRNLVKMRADGEISADEMVEQKTATATELAEIETELEWHQEQADKWITATKEALNLSTNSVEVFKNADTVTRRQLLRGILSSLRLKDKKLYYTTNKAVQMVNECQSIYTALKRTSEPGKVVAAYGDLGHSDPHRNVMRATRVKYQVM